MLLDWAHAYMRVCVLLQMTLLSCMYVFALHAHAPVSTQTLVFYDTVLRDSCIHHSMMDDSHALLIRLSCCKQVGVAAADYQD